MKSNRCCFLVMTLAFVATGCVPLSSDPREPYRPLNQNVPEEETLSFRHCTVDDDCVHVANDCCFCDLRDADLAVNKDQVEAFKAELNCPPTYACTTIGRNPPCGVGEISCDNGLCVYHAPSATRFEYDFGIVPEEKTMPYRACREDADCVYVNNGCCDCATIGHEIAVHQDQKQRFEESLVCPYWFECPPDRDRDPPCGSGRSVCHDGVCRYLVPEGATRILLDGGVGEPYRDLVH